jgi:hypothetical protein
VVLPLLLPGNILANTNGRSKTAPTTLDMPTK